MSLRVRGLQVRYRRVGAAAVDDVHLAVAAGELMAVVGPSGAGKTTLLRAVAGLEPVAAGSVEVGGTDVTAVAPGARDVAMVFQDQALYPHLSVVDNIGFPLEASGLARAAARSAAVGTAEQLGLGHLLDRRPAQLSGGERQRVALARAVVRTPSVFLLDEPLGGLDADRRDAARADFRALQRSTGAATLHVTHDPAEALSIADRVAVMDGGRVLQVASPAEVYDTPATVVVARLLGSPPMNMVTDAVGAALGGRGPTLGVRPEALRLVAAGVGRLDGVVEEVGILGSDEIVRIRAGDQLLLVRRRRGTGGETAGDVAGMDVDASALHHFDEHGNRMR